ncbi:MAG: hypothetical protein WD767_16145 [Alphaproteobacteria bacterium]
MIAEFLLPNLPVDKVIAALRKSPGDEIGSGKFTSPASSAALAVNTFGYFLERPLELPAMPGTENFGWPAKAVHIEFSVRFPWRGGRHPWLDAYVETATHIIGIESKRYEPFRGKSSGTLSDAYWRPVWGDRMVQYERVRDRLNDGSLKPNHLDAVQLVKHAFGLRTQAGRDNKAAVLVYLHAEPNNWPDGRTVHAQVKNVHSEEIRQFADDVAGAEVEFRACTYSDLLKTFTMSTNLGVRQHGQLVMKKFSP